MKGKRVLIIRTLTFTLTVDNTTVTKHPVVMFDSIGGDPTVSILMARSA